MTKMRELPVHDMFTRAGVVRKDGLTVHDMYMSRVKSPTESKGPWDLYDIIRTVPHGEAFRPQMRSLEIGR